MGRSDAPHALTLKGCEEHRRGCNPRIKICRKATLKGYEEHRRGCNPRIKICRKTTLKG